MARPSEISVSVTLLADCEKNGYADFAATNSDALLYHQPMYLAAIEAISASDAAYILIARDVERIVAAMPVLIARVDGAAVVNSLPYFGSHGDILIAGDALYPSRAAAAIVDELGDFCRREHVGAINVISHPITPLFGTLAHTMGLSAWDRRIGQISILPNARDSATAMEGILARCHQKTRNLVRKGLRGGFEISVSNSQSDWESMVFHHSAGMERIGGHSKHLNEFMTLRKALEPHGGAMLYVARSHNEFAGALLVFLFRDWVEYFTPVAVEKYRNSQVLSAMIATAMRDACIDGRRYWNWGGTWASQAGVHHFKNGWGAVDHPYVYFGAVFDPRLSDASPEALRAAFPYFYVRPFS